MLLVVVEMCEPFEMDTSVSRKHFEPAGGDSLHAVIPHSNTVEKKKHNSPLFITFEKEFELTHATAFAFSSVFACERVFFFDQVGHLKSCFVTFSSPGFVFFSFCCRSVLFVAAYNKSVGVSHSKDGSRLVFSHSSSVMAVGLLPGCLY